MPANIVSPRSLRRVQLVVTAATAVILAPRVSLASAITPAELASAKQVIEAVNTDWIAAVQSRDAERIAAPYAMDSVSVGKDGIVILGRAALVAKKKKWLETAPILLGGSLQDDGLTIEDELIYEWGHSFLHWRNADGTTKETATRFLTVWRKDSEEKWLILRNLNF